MPKQPSRSSAIAQICNGGLDANILQLIFIRRVDQTFYDDLKWWDVRIPNEFLDFDQLARGGIYNEHVSPRDLADIRLPNLIGAPRNQLGTTRNVSATTSLAVDPGEVSAIRRDVRRVLLISDSQHFLDLGNESFEFAALWKIARSAASTSALISFAIALTTTLPVLTRPTGGLARNVSITARGWLQIPEFYVSCLKLLRLFFTFLELSDFGIEDELDRVRIDARRTNAGDVEL